MRKILLTGAGAALAAALPIQGSVSVLATSAQAAGQFTVSGTVTGASGPVRVWLYAWPPAAVVRSLRPGQRVPLRVLGEQTTSTGQYALSVNPASLPAGIVNMEVAAFGGSGMTASSFTRTRAVSSGRAVLATLFGPAQMAPQVANMRLAPPNQPPTCLSPELVYQRNLGAKNVVVGATYSKASNFNTGFVYDADQSSSLGVGLSASSTFGDFHADGTSGESSTAEEPFPTYHGVAAHTRITGFRYGLFRWRCAAPHAGSYWANYQAQATDFASGVFDPNTNPNIYPQFCRPFEPNSGVILKRYAAWTFNGGVNIHAVIGINLSSQTGYDLGAQVIYKVTKPGPSRWICGMKNNPGGSNPPPGLIQGH